ncbi:hypothetical protein E2C01_064045 [Portunus trituberculatus]|uniref:Uncharacterized protein n=1 Tax=Portunus trituberculatus TaxID=210409 RepID=A0A5B7HMP3_PORTR|nr:hypothetical protein [Portunus trituberculatus]
MRVLIPCLIDPGRVTRDGLLRRYPHSLSTPHSYSLTPSLTVAYSQSFNLALSPHISPLPHSPPLSSPLSAPSLSPSSAGESVDKVPALNTEQADGL